MKDILFTPIGPAGWGAHRITVNGTDCGGIMGPCETLPYWTVALDSDAPFAVTSEDAKRRLFRSFEAARDFVLRPEMECAA